MMMMMRRRRNQCQKVMCIGRCIGKVLWRARCDSVLPLSFYLDLNSRPLLLSYCDQDSKILLPSLRRILEPGFISLRILAMVVYGTHSVDASIAIKSLVWQDR